MLDFTEMQQNEKHTSYYSQVEAIKENNETVLKIFYKDNYYKIEKYVLNNSGSKEEAKDIFQDAFIAVWRNIQLDKFSPENEGALAGYLYRIAKNKWLDYLRSGHYKKMVPLADAPDEIEDGLLEKEDDLYINEVKKNFDELGGNCREVLIRFYFNKESMKTIASHFNWTEATTRNNKYRCLQKLRELLKK